MADRALFINGAPGSGKTTLARRLAAVLELPLLTKDGIKESLADAVSVPLPTRRLGAIASDTLWSLVGAVDGAVIVESFWFAGRDDEYFRRGVATAGVTDGIEVWCEASPETTQARFVGRPRHHAHDDEQRTDEAAEFRRLARPISGFPVLPVDTEGPVDVDGLAARIRTLLPL
ncbi:AAA family ATPase [Leifsonia sp. NPDC058194]|uniref:AAA family ATPase n=1 Tax=Leifsonia sp. NPDC058194 TaxID=3346374 RepID=UPI0036DAA15A